MFAVIGFILIAAGAVLVFGGWSDLNSSPLEALSFQGPKKSATPTLSGIEQIAATLPTGEQILTSSTTISFLNTEEFIALTASHTPQPTYTPTDTPLPTDTATSTHSPEPTATPIDLFINPKDGAEMVHILEGEFLMGSNPDDPYFWGAEAPEHYVHLDEYWIYRTEVTNAMYAACVAEKACPMVVDVSSETRGEYYGVARFDDYPVIYVSWTHAQSYCVWAGGKLPTEAQWEKAARGTDGRMFPWGNEPLTGSRANYCDRQCYGFTERDSTYDDGYADTAPVGSYLEGASPYGVLDMAGNVWEWCLDYFQPGYYSTSPYENPPGPGSSRHRVVRGGSFGKISDGVRTAVRYGIRPDISLSTTGFRCVFNALE